METTPKNKLAKWLDKIQQDSWQLELIVSGFAIFLMIGALDALRGLKLQMNLTLAGIGMAGTFLTIAWATLAGACFFFLLNLISHVVLRGLWISAIGLRSVSGDIDFNALRVLGSFDRYLRRTIGSFDHYIQKLDNLCSIVFAFTFLIVFMFVALLVWGLILLSFLMLINSIAGFNPKAVMGLILLAFLFSSLLYFIDFVTLGFLKRVKWLEPVYYPIYRFYSFITLASFYRPIYYNLIDNKFGRRAGYLLVPYVATVLFLASLRADSYVWFPEDTKGLDLKRAYYDDLRGEKSLVGNASIPSRFVKNGFLELFIRYFPSADDKALAVVCPDFEPLKKPGIGTDIISIKEVEKLRTNPPESLKCLASLYEVRVDDSLFATLAFRFFEHPNKGEKGLITTLDVAYLPRGQHEIFLRKKATMKTEGRDTLIVNEFVKFPFWKE